jgi:glycosyltransferase involved in cell wall biosynthesis
MPALARRPLIILSLEPVSAAGEASGAGVHIRTLLGCLAEAGEEVHALTISDQDEDDGPFITHRLGSGLPLTLRYLYQIIALFRLRLYRTPDVLYTRTSLNAGVGMIVFAGGRHTPMICEVNGFANEEWLHRDLGRAQSESSVRRAVSWMNRKLILRAERSAIYNADRLVAVTEGIRRRLIAEYGVSPERISVIGNGADTDRFSPISRESACKDIGLSPGFLYLCYVGTFMPWHALPVILEATAIVQAARPDVRLLLVGDGDGRAGAEQQAKDLGIADSVIFTGRVPHDLVPAYIAASTLCLATFTSARNDGIGLSPLKVYEYLACGRPVVASDIEGVTETLCESGGGLVVPPDDAAGLAAAIVALLDDGGEGERMGIAGRKWVAENRSWKAVGAEMIGVMREVLGNT